MARGQGGGGAQTPTLQLEIAAEKVAAPKLWEVTLGILAMFGRSASPDIEIDVYVDGTLYASVTTDAEGRATCIIAGLEAGMHSFECQIPGQPATRRKRSKSFIPIPGLYPERQVVIDSRKVTLSRRKYEEMVTLTVLHKFGGGLEGQMVRLFDSTLPSPHYVDYATNSKGVVEARLPASDRPRMIRAVVIGTPIESTRWIYPPQGV